MSKRIRQYLGIIVAVTTYYIIHEGAHLIVALKLGVFKKINFMGLGIQIDVENSLMSDIQLGIFCLAGALATFTFGWILVLFCKQICKMKSQVIRAIAWYTTLTLLLLDPVYLSILCSLFGGGDMNGISLLCPEITVRILFACLGIFHITLVILYLLPRYRKSFADA